MIGKISTIFALGLLAACAGIKEQAPTERVVYVNTPLMLPEKPQLPRMRSDALKCISDADKWTLLKRDVLLKDYISQLETIIMSTQQTKK